MNRLRTVLALYLQVHPDEEEALAPLRRLLEESTSWADLISRKNPVGHLTASGVVVHPVTRKVILVHHRTLGLYLQPGGHVEPSDSSLFEAAVREIREETPVTELNYLPSGADPDLPLDIDCHDIPSNPAKQEGRHVHIDWRYLFTLPQERLGELAEASPTADFAWISFDEMARMPTLTRLAQKSQARFDATSLQLETRL